MDDRDDALAPYEAELASDRVVQALVIKLSWQPMSTGRARDSPDQMGPDE